MPLVKLYFQPEVLVIRRGDPVLAALEPSLELRRTVVLTGSRLLLGGFSLLLTASSVCVLGGGRRRKTGSISGVFSEIPSWMLSTADYLTMAICCIVRARVVRST